jgi:ABC-2 type transport system permease protein
MTRGLIAKTVREVWLSTLLFALALAAFEVLFARILPAFLEEFSDQWLEFKFVQNILKALLGTEADSAIGRSALAAIAWVHPVVLALIWAHAITFCTRLPAGEVDRGTVDVLLSLPVSRRRLYICETVVWLVTGMFVIAMGLAGSLIGGWSVPQDLKVKPEYLIIIISNLFCMYFAVAGIACLVSSMSNRRGRAVSVVFAIVVASLFLSFLAQFSDLAHRLSFLSVLSYYQPLPILRDGTWPVTDMLVLSAVGAVAALAGLLIFTRRDICTV